MNLKPGRVWRRRTSGLRIQDSESPQSKPRCEAVAWEAVLSFLNSGTVQLQELQHSGKDSFRLPICSKTTK